MPVPREKVTQQLNEAMTLTDAMFALGWLKKEDTEPRVAKWEAVGYLSGLTFKYEAGAYISLISRTSEENRPLAQSMVTNLRVLRKIILRMFQDENSQTHLPDGKPTPVFEVYLQVSQFLDAFDTGARLAADQDQASATPHTNADTTR